MELRQAVRLIDQHLEAHRGKRLTVAEKVALKAAWLDIRYDHAIAENDDVSSNYVSSRVAPELWKTLTDVFKQPIKKKNIRSFLEQNPVPLLLEGENSFVPGTFEDSLLSSLPFVGRGNELKVLESYLKHYQCLNICGESGIGKSHLTRQLLSFPDIQARFDRVIFSSVCHAPSLESLCESLLTEFAAGDASAKSSEDLMNHLFEILKSQRVLIVLDSAEMWGTTPPHIEPFLRRVCEEELQSVILILSRSPFTIISALQTKRYPCRVFRLEGLQSEDAEKILESYGLQDESNWPQLIQKYRGNPLALMQASEMILNLFDGRVKMFIDLETTVIFDNFEEAYKSYPFSPNELEILQIIRKHGQAKISEIIKAFNQSHSTLISLLNSLLANSFIERQVQQEGYVYSVPPMLAKYLAHFSETPGDP